MKAILMKHKPKDSTKEEFTKKWEAASTTLQPLCDLLCEMRDQKGHVRHTDFELPNHYGKLIAELAEKDMIDFIISLLPDGCDRSCK